ncbi:MAG: hypothetical protein R2874_06070 [Desulfobacterales bacterium]
MTAFFFISGVAHFMAGISIKNLAVFLPAVLIGYFIFNQNRLEIRSDAIVQSFLLPFIPGKIIRIAQIEWVALKPAVLRRNAIIKLKNGELVKIPLALLELNREAKTTFASSLAK